MKRDIERERAKKNTKFRRIELEPYQMMKLFICNGKSGLIGEAISWFGVIQLSPISTFHGINKGSVDTV